MHGNAWLLDMERCPDEQKTQDLHATARHGKQQARLPLPAPCQDADIRTVMVTGDHARTAVSVAHKCGMLCQNQPVRSPSGQALWDLVPGAVQACLTGCKILAFCLSTNMPAALFHRRWRLLTQR